MLKRILLFSTLVILLGAFVLYNTWQKSPSLTAAIEKELVQEKNIADEKQHSFQFAVLGDSRVVPDSPQHRGYVVLSELLQRINKENADFTVYVGDGPDKGGPISYLVSFREAMNKLKNPWYPVIGNHELSGGAAPDGNRGDGENNFLSVFDDKLPLKDSRGNRLSYYSFDHLNSHFIVLDTAWQDRKGHRENKLYPGNPQWEWLIQDMESARSKSKHIFIFGHEPPLLPNRSELKNYRRFSDTYRTSWHDPEAVDAFVHLCRRYRVDAVFSGHFHGYLNFKDGHTTHIVTGGAGADLYAPAEAGGFFHYTLCEIQDDNVSYKVVRKN